MLPVAKKAGLKDKAEAPIMAAQEQALQAVTAYNEKYYQVAGIVYKNIRAAYGLDVPKSRWEIFC